MKEYEAPKLEVILFQPEDCITASSSLDVGTGGPDDTPILP